MTIINDFAKTESFLESKLINAQLDSFRVYSIELQVNFLANSSEGKQSYWLSATGDISLCDGDYVCRDRSEVIEKLHGLIGHKISAVKIETNGALAISFGSKVLTICLDDEAFEVIWSVTPESPEPYTDHEWSVTLTDESELVMSLPASIKGGGDN